MSLGYERPYWADEDWADVPPTEAPDKQMTIEEKFRDYDVRIKAGGINAEPCHYFKAGYLFGAHAVKASVVPALAQDGERISVEETLEIVGSYGPYGKDINESLRMQIVLADEVKRLRGLYESTAAPTPPAQYSYEAACSGLRYTIPEACGNVSAIHLDGKRWPVAMDGWRDAMSEALDVVAQYAPGFSLLIERMEKILDATTPPAPEVEPLTRFCPSCGLIGEAGEQYRDCCPDGNDARMVPVQFAGKCRTLFKLAIGETPAPEVDLGASQWPPAQE